VELVTIDAYLSELVPAHMRGRAFALNQCITYCAVPTVAFLSWRLVPLTPYGIDGWRWVIALGAIVRWSCVLASASAGESALARQHRQA